MSPMSVAVFLCALAAALALPRPQQQQQQRKQPIIPIVDQRDTRDEFGQFAYQYTSGDGTTLSEQGALKPTADNKDLVLVKTGSYQYTSPEGQQFSVEYQADENGFRPTGAHIPSGAAPQLG